MAVAIPLIIYVKKTVLNFHFVWLLVSFVLLEETKCAVPIDIVMKKVTATEKPPRWIIKMIPDAEPLIPHYRRDHQHNSNLKLNKKQYLVHLLQNYHSDESYQPSKEESINKQSNLLNINRDSIDNYSGETKQTKKRFRQLIATSDQKETQEHINRYQYPNNKNHYQLAQYLYKHLLQIMLRYFLNKRNDLDDFSLTTNRRPSPNYENQVSNEKSVFGDIQEVLEDVRQTNDKDHDRSEQETHDNINRYGKMADARHSLEAIPINSQELKISGDTEPAIRKRQKRHTSHLEWHYPDSDNYFSYSHWPAPRVGEPYEFDDPRNRNNPFYGKWWAKYVPGRFQNDDYQPFLWAQSNPYPQRTVQHGSTIFHAQIIPLFKSMILGKGIEQGPLHSPFRVHWGDLQHYGEGVVPPPPGPPLPFQNYRKAQGLDGLYLPTDEELAKEYNLETTKSNEEHIPEPLASYRRKILSIKSDDVISMPVAKIKKNKVKKPTNSREDTETKKSTAPTADTKRKNKNLKKIRIHAAHTKNRKSNRQTEKFDFQNSKHEIDVWWAKKTNATTKSPDIQMKKATKSTPINMIDMEKLRKILKKKSAAPKKLVSLSRTNQYDDVVRKELEEIGFDVNKNYTLLIEVTR